MPWLLWCFERQSWPHKELVIVDSSAAPISLAGPLRQRVVAMAPGSSVPDKRNRALAEARGELVAWFDDDDWQHPERLSQLVALFGSASTSRSEGRAGTVWAGPRSAWLLDLGQLEAWRLPELEQGVLFNGSAFARDFARQYVFDARRRRASDTLWLSELLRASESAPLVATPNFFWLFHGNNLSLRPRQRSRATAAFVGPSPVSALRTALGADAWGDTDQQLTALRARLAGALAAQSRGGS